MDGSSGSGPQMAHADGADEAEVPLAELSESELLDEINEAEHRLITVDAQLRAESSGVTSRGVPWFMRAQIARKHIATDLQTYRAELARRRRPADPLLPEPLRQEVASLSDEELTARIERERKEVERVAALVTAHLQKRQPQPRTWIEKANASLAVMRLSLRILNIEDTKRKQGQSKPKHVPRGAHPAMLEKLDEIASRTRDPRAILSVWQEERERARAQLFLQAADELMGKEEKRRVWAHAIGMAPKHFALCDSPTLRQVNQYLAGDYDWIGRDEGADR